MKAWRGLLLVVWTGVAVAGGVYKWTDANGGVHFGERPPPGAQSQQMPEQTTPMSDSSDDEAARDQKRQKLLNAFDQEQADQQARAQKTKKQAAVRSRNCAIARDQLNGLTDSNHIYTLDADGKRHYFNDNERAAARQSARAAVSQWCD